MGWPGNELHTWCPSLRNCVEITFQDCAMSFGYATQVLGHFFGLLLLYSLDMIQKRQNIAVLQSPAAKHFSHFSHSCFPDRSDFEVLSDFALLEIDGNP